jgi:hypothetical protein
MHILLRFTEQGRYSKRRSRRRRRSRKKSSGSSDQKKLTAIVETTSTIVIEPRIPAILTNPASRPTSLAVLDTTTIEILLLVSICIHALDLFKSSL